MDGCFRLILNAPTFLSSFVAVQQSVGSKLFSNRDLKYGRVRERTNEIRRSNSRVKSVPALRIILEVRVIHESLILQNIHPSIRMSLIYGN